MAEETYECQTCKKRYKYYGWVVRHSLKGHFRFKRIKNDEFKFTDDTQISKRKSEGSKKEIKEAEN